MPEASLPVFKTITLGQYTSPQEYRKALKGNRCRVQRYADEVLDKIEISPQPIDLHLVIVSVAELGFRTSVPYDVIWKRVNETGLQLCPAEVGPALRLRYLDQPKRADELLRIGMCPVHHAAGAYVFDLMNIPGPRWMGRGLWLGLSGIDTITLGDKVFGPGARFVFASPQLRD